MLQNFLPQTREKYGQNLPAFIFGIPYLVKHQSNLTLRTLWRRM